MRDGKGIFDVVEVPPEALAILGGDWARVRVLFRTASGSRTRMTICLGADAPPTKVPTAS